MPGPHAYRPSPAQAGTPLLEVAAAGAVPLRVRQQVVLSTYWFSLSFHGGALFGVAVPAQLLGLARDADKAWLLGLLGGFSSLIGMLAQPAAGVLSDLSSSRWGRRRPYLLGGLVFDVAGLVIMAGAGSLSQLFLGFMLAGFGSGVSMAAYQAYIPDHVPAAQYGEASGYMGAMTMLGTIGSFGAAAFLVTPGSAGPFYVATIAVMVIGALVTAIGIPDPSAVGRERPIVGSWRALWLDPWRAPDFSWVFATRAMMMLALYTLFTFVEYYVRDVVHVTSFVQGAAAIAAIATLAALVGGLFTGWASDRVGRKGIVSVASVLMATALSVLAVVHQLGAVLALGIVFGLALGIYTAVDWALAIDVLPDRAFAAKDLGLWGISTNLPQTLAPFVGGAVLVALAPYGAAVGYGALFAGGAVCAGLSGIFVWRVRGAR